MCGRKVGSFLFLRHCVVQQNYQDFLYVLDCSNVGQVTANPLESEESPVGQLRK